MSELKEKTVVNNGKNKKFNSFLKSFFKVIIIGYLICFVLFFVVKRYNKNKTSIYYRLGENASASIPIKDALIIRERSLTPYASLGKAGKYDVMYSMLTSEYKGYMSYDSYVQSLQGIDWDSFAMESIKSKTQNTFEAKVTYKKNGEEVHTNFLVYNSSLNPNVYTISPNNFVYGYFNQTIKADDLELNISELIVYSDYATLKGTIKNTSWTGPKSVFSINITYNSKLVSRENVSYDVEKGEEKPISVKYDGLNYFVPNTVDIDVVEGEDNIKTVSFKLEQQF